MRFHSFKKQLALYGIGLAFVLGCEKNMPDAPKAVATPEKPLNVRYGLFVQSGETTVTEAARRAAAFVDPINSNLGGR